MKKLITAVNLVLLFCIIDFGMKALFTYAAWKIAPVTVSATAPDPSPVERGPDHVKDRSAYTLIAERDLFKTKKAGEKAADSNPENQAVDLDKLEQTALNLKLLGTVTGMRTVSYAVIENSRNNQMLYKKGDSVENALIKRILRKKVILSVNGKDEILLMANETGPGNRKRSDNRGPSPGSNSFDSRRQIIEKSEISRMVESADDWVRHLRIRPFFQNNQMEGFRINGIRDSSVFKKLGIENGDVITSVDDRKIRSVKDIMELYQKLKSGRTGNAMDIEIKRNGTLKNLEYSIE